MKKQTEPSPGYVGVDISKEALDASLGEEAVCRYENNAAGIAQLLKALRKLPARVHVICEPSGGYERELLEALWAAELDVSLVNAARIRAFARAQGLLAKTDVIDARVLRQFGALLRPEKLAAPSPARQRLAALVQRREQLLGLVTMEEHRLSQTREAVVRKMSESLLQELKNQVAQLEQLIESHIDDDPTLKAQNERLQEVKGIGKVTASTLLAELPELGQLTRNEHDPGRPGEGAPRTIHGRDGRCALQSDPHCVLPAPGRCR
jgi:transposase